MGLMELLKKPLRKVRNKWRDRRNRPVLLYPHRDQRRGTLTVGEGTLLGRGIEIDCTGTVEIGRHCVVSDGVKILTHSHDFNSGWVEDITLEKGIKITHVRIGDNVSIGAEAMIMPKVKFVGDNSVIGARSVVTKPVGEGEIWAGNPARKIGERPRGERRSERDQPVQP